MKKQEIEKQGELYFNIDFPEMMKRLIESTPNGSYVHGVPMAVLRDKITKLAQRCIELNDPQLNIIMLEMKLYEVPHSEIQDLIKQQKARIN